MFPFTSSSVPPYDEALYWLKFTCTGDQMGAYMAPASIDFVQSVIVEG